MTKRLSLALLVSSVGAACADPVALQPFVLPWNETSTGPADLSNGSPAPAGSQGFVTVDASGHYVVGGNRIRFLGVNITSNSCFPIPGHADAAATRLAKFGVNSVRFHHMDAVWLDDVPLLDYPSGDTRRLNPEAFARLHHFVGALRKNGIYSNINLLVSRHFTAADGFPQEIGLLDWKDGHILGFFDEHALELQKEFARNLLTTPGPRGEVPLAQNPAVAFVELLNENGIIQKWYEGVLDNLGAPFRKTLSQRWHTWLRQRYSSTEALRKAWGGAHEADGAIIVKGELNAPTGWKLELSPHAAAKIQPKIVGDAHDVTELAITNVDTNEWEQARFRSGVVTLKPGRLYTMSFAAKASRAATVHMGASGTRPNQSVRIGHAKIGSGWSRHQASFVAPQDSQSLTFTFGGLNAPGTYTFSDLMVREGGTLQGLPDSASLEAGDVPMIPGVANASAKFTPEAYRDWLRFLTDLEHRYWATMSDFVKTTLGYRGVVFGTIISNSPATVQARLDSVDGHCYWTHPKFPQGEWDPKAWIVTPKSMVVDPAGSSVAQLAQQRVKGRPFTVTEYQHASPNPYSAEGPIFAAAYGALQDWDGIWFFDYNVPVSKKDLPTYEGRIANFFDDSQHPARMANYLLAASLFLRGDVSPARDVVAVPLPAETEIELLRTRAGAWNMPEGSMLGLERSLALEKRVALDVSAASAATALPKITGKNRHHVSDTGELTWNASDTSKAVFTAVTPRTQVAVGFLGREPVALGNTLVQLAGTNLGWATVGLTWREGDLSTPGGARGLLVATAQVENSNQVWKDSFRSTLGNDWGQAPTRIETVLGELILPVPAQRVKAFALDIHGRRTAQVTVSSRDNKAVLALGSAGVTVWYEVVLEPATP